MRCHRFKVHVQCYIALHGQAVLLGKMFKRSKNLCRKHCNIYRIDVAFTVSGLESAEIDHFLYQAVQTLGILLDQPYIAADIIVGVFIGKQAFAWSVDQSQRRTEFMRYIGKKAKFLFIKLIVVLPFYFSI